MEPIPFLSDGQLLQDPLSYDESGLVAIGGNLSSESLINAYSKGVFPWYNEEELIQWWSPDPRCILYPSEVSISKSMSQVMRSARFRFKINHDFPAVIKACGLMKRKDQDGTWIHEEIIAAYTDLYKLGIAISGETYEDGLLVGGLYGVKLGSVFFGESMFSKTSNASKYAFINFCKFLHKSGVVLIDCQMETAHLMSLGAELIPRKKFIELLDEHLKN